MYVCMLRTYVKKTMLQCKMYFCHGLEYTCLIVAVVGVGEPMNDFSQDSDVTRHPR